ncbi:hypothetical protein J2X92_004884 [Variovorax paradoxus]|nr:hypothetical protein [Variovorax paradoxus]MDP9932629.1 hypothetical protein [Variovorax paradoxus]
MSAAVAVSPPNPRDEIPARACELSLFATSPPADFFPHARAVSGAATNAPSAAFQIERYVLFIPCSPCLVLAVDRSAGKAESGLPLALLLLPIRRKGTRGAFAAQNSVLFSCRHAVLFPIRANR